MRLPRPADWPFCPDAVPVPGGSCHEAPGRVALLPGRSPGAGCELPPRAARRNPAPGRSPRHRGPGCDVPETRPDGTIHPDVVPGAGGSGASCHDRAARRNLVPGHSSPMPRARRRRRHKSAGPSRGRDVARPAMHQVPGTPGNPPSSRPFEGTRRPCRSRSCSVQSWVNYAGPEGRFSPRTGGPADRWAGGPARTAAPTEHRGAGTLSSRAGPSPVERRGPAPGLRAGLSRNLVRR